MRACCFWICQILIAVFPLQGIELEESLQIEQNLRLLKRYSTSDLLKMWQAGQRVQRWNARITRGKSSVLHELMRGEGSFKKGKRFPRQGVFDPTTYSKYFYHAHRPQEHGHFHLFVYEKGLDPDIQPAFFDNERHVVHLFGLSIDAWGAPRKVFMINQWVTDEAWYSASDTARALSQFSITHTSPSYALNQWLKEMIILFRPQIVSLLFKRDRLLEEAGGEAALRKKELEVLGEEEIAVEKQLFALQVLLKERQALTSH